MPEEIFFETYRFSEDLDFTIIKPEHLDADFLKNVFSEIGEWIYEQTGIEIPPDKQDFEIYRNPRGQISCQGKISYKGPVSSTHGLPRIKIDLIADEQSFYHPSERRFSSRTAMLQKMVSRFWPITTARHSPRNFESSLNERVHAISTMSYTSTAMLRHALILGDSWKFCVQSVSSRASVFRAQLTLSYIVHRRGRAVHALKLARPTFCGARPFALAELHVKSTIAELPRRSRHLLSAVVFTNTP